MAAPRALGQVRVLDLGCGAGAALLCLGARVPGLALHGVELQPAYARLCRQNAERNGIEAQIWEADISALPGPLRSESFDHVIMNPPYFQRDRGSASPVDHRDTAFGGATPLAVWIDGATRRLKPKGHLMLIQKADRLADVLGALDDRMGSIGVWPIAGRAGRSADRILVRARKGGRAPLQLGAPIVLHSGKSHTQDAEDYCPEIHKILRHAAPLALPS